MSIDKGWLNQCFFNKFFKESIDNVTYFSIVFLNWNFLVSSDGFSFFEGHVLPEINTCNFFDSVNHVYTFEWFVKFNLISLIDNWSVAFNSFCNVLNNAFSQVHDILEVCISLVNLDRSELRIVCSVHSFVTEDTTNLIHTFHTTDDKSFQVKLSRDTKHHVNVLCIVVSDKWTSSSTTSFIVKHRCFNFKESFLV